jgi:hypothetical protein
MLKNHIAKSDMGIQQKIKLVKLYEKEYGNRFVAHKMRTMHKSRNLINVKKVSTGIIPLQEKEKRNILKIKKLKKNVIVLNKKNSLLDVEIHKNEVKSTSYKSL